jgi:transposase
MLGPVKPRHLDAPVTVSLEDLVPRDHFYRHLEAKLDLSVIRDWTRELYTDRGRPSIDPVIFFKLQLVMFFAGIRSERQLVATPSLNLAHRWYLGYALDEPLPDHSSLTRIRQRLGIDIFQRFFERVVDLCQEAGLVWGKECYFDATKVVANADLDSLVPRFSHAAKTHVVDLFADDVPTDAAEGESEAVASALPAGVVRLPNTASDEVGRAGPPPWKLLEERRLDPQRPSSGSYMRTSDFGVSTTDPDATPMRTGHGTSLGSHDHDVVDGSKRRIILAALVTPADMMENVPLRDLLWRVCFRRKVWPHQVTGDTTYGTVENIVAVENAGIRAYTPLPDWGSRRAAFFAQADFTYDAERDEYRCPQQHPLRRETAKPGEEVVVYRGNAATCNTCLVKAACTTSDHGRIVHHFFYADHLEKVQGYHVTEAYKKAMCKRQIWVEPLFAEAKEWHGLRRLRLRGLMNANIQGLLIAAGQNLKRFLAATGWGRRHAPCGSLIALSNEAHRLSAAYG